MNEYVERTGGSELVIGLIALIIVAVVIGLLVMPGITGNLAEVRTQKTAGIQAGEAGKTERATQEQQTLRASADLRAEATARAQNIATLILTGGLVLIGGLLFGGLFMFGLERAADRQLQRTLLLIEAQREARQLAQPQAYMQIEPSTWASRPRPVTINGIQS